MASRKKIKVKYKDLDKHKVWGYASTTKNFVELNIKLKGKKHLEILTHELLHVLLPDATEEEIERLSINLTLVLWSEGYRRVDDSNHIPLQDGKK